MAVKKDRGVGVKIAGIGTHKISFDFVDESVRKRVLECIKTNGKISIGIGVGRAGEVGARGFEQTID